MEQKSNTVVQDTEEISLKDLILRVGRFFSYLRSKWILLCIFMILGGIIGFAYAWSKKPVYVASTTFVLDDGSSNTGGGSIAGLASIVGLDLGNNGGGIFQGDNILELYKSRAMIKKALLTEVEYNGKRQLLIERFIEFKGFRQGWEKSPALKNLSFAPSEGSDGKRHFSRLQDSVMGRISDEINLTNLKVAKPDKKLSIIRADVTSPDEYFSKVFNEQIVKNVNDFYIQTKTKKSLESISILQQKTDSVRSVMNGAIYTVAAVTDATPNLNPTRQVQRNVPIQRSQFSVETNKAILGSLVQNLELTKMSLLKETPLIQVIDQPILPLPVDSISRSKTAVIGSMIGLFLLILVLAVKQTFKAIIA